MKRLTLLIFSACFLLMNSNSQNIELTFTAIDSAEWVQLDSIKVMNRTQGGDTVLYYPDTVLSFFVTGINEFQKIESGFQLHQNYPNPVVDQTTIAVNIPSAGKVNISVTDILGRRVTQLDQELEAGSHSFRFTPGKSDVYFFTTRYKNESKSIKMLCAPFKLESNVSLKYVSSTDEPIIRKSSKSIQNFSFNFGDELLYIGYYDTLQSGMLDSPEEINTYTFQFAYDIPCPGTPTVDYEGQVYNTVQIMSQCWLKENLNVGTMIAGWDDMTDNDFIEKYCYDNELDSCAKYGGLYQWDEMMQYTSQQGTQGICPPGWHLPNETEWNVLEGAADSQYNIGDLIWDEAGYRGFDAGFNLKSTSGWSDGGNGSDLFGFSGLPAGARGDNAVFLHIEGFAHWWVSTEIDTGIASAHHMRYYNTNASQWDNPTIHGFSVRCLED